VVAATVRSGPEDLPEPKEPVEAARGQRPETAVAIGMFATKR
jgi:hypothetical protein